MRVAIMTMVYNERVNLPIWIRHYRRQCPEAALIVLDHGSDDGSTIGLNGVTVLPLGRSGFDDITRAEAIGDLQSALLKYYDTVIYVDCDEMILPDPEIFRSLAEFLDTVHDPVIAPTGLNVQHLTGVEAPIDLSRPILGQRRHARFTPGLCKPLITRVPVRWVAGFHWCDQRPAFRADLYLFHLKYMDFALALRRHQAKREMDWSERSMTLNLAPRQRWPDDRFVEEGFREAERQLLADGPVPFEFQSGLAAHETIVVENNRLLPGRHRAGPIAVIPERFTGYI